MRSKRGISPATWVIGGSLAAFACSLTAPSKDELFRAGGGGLEGEAGAGPNGGTSSGSGGKSAQGGTSGAAVAGDAGAGGNAPSQDAGAGGTSGGAGGTGAGESGSAGEGATGPGSSGAGGEGGEVVLPPFEPNEGLLGRYTFDETSGAVAADSIGGLDATVNGTATWVGGKIGGAVRLSGTAAYVDVPVTTLASLDEVTFALWFNPGTQTLWTRVLDLGSSKAHWMYFSPAAAPTGQGTGTHIALDVSNQITAEMHVTTFVPPIQTWTHVVISWSRNEFAYYLNGELADRDDTPIFTPAEFVTYTPSGEMLRLWLGRSSFDVDAYFTGALDDLRIYDRALPPQYAQELYEVEE